MSYRPYEDINKIIIEKEVKDTRLLVGDFAILWNLFEKKYINRFENEKPNEKKIEDLKNLAQKFSCGCLPYEIDKKEILINECFELFKKYCNKFYLGFRYSDILYNFNIEKNSEVDKSMKEIYSSNEEDWNTKNKLCFLLLIIYRVRNNMFHGTKKPIELDKKKDLFIVCNNILSLFLDNLESLLKQ